MSPLVIVLTITLTIVVAILLKINYSAEQKITCPYCQLEFVADLFLLGSSTLIICPFCHRWITVTKSYDRYIARKLFV